MLLRRVLIRRKLSFELCQKLALSTSLNVKENFDHGKMKSWQIHSYGEELQLTNSRRPVLKNPDDVIIEVFASSVNPIDVAMMNSYGSVLLNCMRQVKECSIERILELPLTLGRDFAGVVLQKGHGVGNKYSIGDEVWGVVPLHNQGSHAEQVVVPKNCIQKKPTNISMVQAGSMMYAAVTAWSALKVTGGLGVVSPRGRKILVVGGSGGVGSMAVQLLSSWGAQVVATCNTDAVQLLESLGVIDIVNYKEPNFFEQIKKHKYDIILDCAGLGQENAAPYLQCLSDYKFSKYITLKSPLVKNIDEYGLLGGMVKNAADLAYANLSSGVLSKLSFVTWGFFLPLPIALAEITEEVSKGRLIPVIHTTYAFAQLPEAYKKVEAGHLRGKVAIDMKLQQ